ncbi:MAG: hypothetical protein ACLUCQ_06615, partial [Enterocloster sp.]
MENKQVESNQSFYPAESMFFLWQNKNPLILQGVQTVDKVPAKAGLFYIYNRFSGIMGLSERRCF